MYGLEKSINKLQEASPVLGRLNNDRDLLRRAIPVPLLIWLPDFALDFIARGAPDFWAWRSGVYEFATERTLWQRDGNQAIISDVLRVNSLSHHEKNAEIAHLEELLRTARSLPRKGKRERGLITSLLDQMGLIYQNLGDWEKSTTIYQENLKSLKALNDQRGVASTQHQLALLEQFRGNLREAERLYRQSLSVKQSMGDNIGIAITLHQLAMVEQDRGNREEAERLYRQNLEFERNIGDKSGVADSLHQLAILEQDRTNFQEAERLYCQSLEIKQGLGDKSGIAITLHQLARLQHVRGNLEEADRLYRQSLEIARNIGDRSGIAITEVQLGKLYQNQKNWHAALQHSLDAWLTFCELHSPYSGLVLSDIGEIREQISKEQFQAWLAEDFAPCGSEIQKRLDEALSAPADAMQRKAAKVG